MADPIAVSPDEAARLTSLSRRTIFYALQGTLKSVKVGKRRLIRVSDLDAWLNEQQVPGK